MDIQTAIRTIEEQDALLQQLTESANKYGTVVGKDGKFLAVSLEGKMVRCNNPKKQYKIGDSVLIIPDTGQIAGTSSMTSYGNAGSLVTVLPDGRLEVDIGGSRSLKPASEHIDKSKLVPGVKVILDHDEKVVVEVIEANNDNFAVESANVLWDEIGGNEIAKSELREALTLLQGGSSLSKAYGIKSPKGILLYGPPGCGKTLLGKAAATELCVGDNGAFLYVKATELLSSYVGMAEAGIRQMFSAAKERYKKTGIPVVIFVDEADAILQRRGSGISSDVEKTIVPTFLTEMDGLEDSGAFVILATNRPDTLDPAVIRDGRIDRRIEVERPDMDNSKQIFMIHLTGVPICKESDIHTIATEATQSLFANDNPLSEMVSGALIAGAVERAKRNAFKRDIGSRTPSGINSSDINFALEAARKEYA